MGGLRQPPAASVLRRADTGRPGAAAGERPAAPSTARPNSPAATLDPLPAQAGGPAHTPSPIVCAWRRPGHAAQAVSQRASGHGDIRIGFGARPGSDDLSRFLFPVREKDLGTRARPVVAGAGPAAGVR